MYSWEVCERIIRMFVYNRMHFDPAPWDLSCGTNCIEVQLCEQSLNIATHSAIANGFYGCLFLLFSLDGVSLTSGLNSTRFTPRMASVDGTTILALNQKLDRLLLISAA